MLYAFATWFECEEVNDSWNYLSDSLAEVEGVILQLQVWLALLFVNMLKCVCAQQSETKRLIFGAVV